MSPRWNGYTLLPFAAHSAAASETAKAVSVPRLFKRSASTELPPSTSLDCTKCQRSASHAGRLACPTMRGETDSSNWIDGPHNRWGFLHVRELTRTARIGGAPPPPAPPPPPPGPLPPRNTGLSGFPFDHLDRRWRFDEMLEATFTDGVMVVVDDVVTFE